MHGLRRFRREGQSRQGQVPPLQRPRQKGHGDGLLPHATRLLPTAAAPAKPVVAPAPNAPAKGVIKDRAVQTLPVPKGVDNKERLKITGKGECGVRNGPPGNLYVEITVDDHTVFHRDACDIHMVAPITLSQAVLGGPIRIPTLVGEVETKVPAGTQQGDKVVIRGRGVNRPTQQKTGDFYIHFAIMLPKELTERQTAAVAEFAKDEEATKLTDPQLQELKSRYKSWFTA